MKLFEHPVLAADLALMHERLSSELEALSGRTLYLTGAAGFLGKYLTLVPLYWNHRNPNRPAIRVVAVDNFKLRTPDWLPQVRSPHFECRTWDVTQGIAPGIDFDYAIHAASIASPSFYRRHPMDTIEANVFGLWHLLKYGEKTGRLRSLLFFSSSEIYGDPEVVPTPESYNGNVSCTGPRACYDESKRLGETLCLAAFQQHGVPVKIARPFNSYGPGMSLDDKRLLPDLIRATRDGTPLTLLSDGTPTRTFCYVADSVTGFYLAFLKGRNGESYNIGADKPEISVLNLAETVKRVAAAEFGIRPEIQFRPSADPKYLSDNPQRRCPDLSKSRRELGYAPSVPLETGLSRYLAWAGCLRLAKAG